MLTRCRDINWTAPAAYVLGAIAAAMLIAQAYARIERRRIDWAGGTA